MSGIDLFWIPLGADGRVVRLSGAVYESIHAVFHRHRRSPLFHSALEIHVAEGRYVVEVTPVPDGQGAERGVVAEGPVGMRWAGSLRLFRYEVRRWLGGSIPDVHAAVGGPVRVTGDDVIARRALQLLPTVPTLVWGRDETRAGDMWNSNSVVAFALTGAGVDAGSLTPPGGGRAPGWRAGIAVARRRSLP